VPSPPGPRLYARDSRPGGTTPNQSAHIWITSDSNTCSWTLGIGGAKLRQTRRSRSLKCRRGRAVPVCPRLTTARTTPNQSTSVGITNNSHAARGRSGSAARNSDEHEGADRRRETPARHEGSRSPGRMPATHDRAGGPLRTSSPTFVWMTRVERLLGRAGSAARNFVSTSGTAVPRRDSTTEPGGCHANQPKLLVSCVPYARNSRPRGPIRTSRHTSVGITNDSNAARGRSGSAARNSDEHEVADRRRETLANTK
jgi:hypothetical protein